MIAEDKLWLQVRDDYYHYLKEQGLRKLHGNKHEGYFENRGAIINRLPWEHNVDRFVGREACRFIENYGGEGPFAMMVDISGGDERNLAFIMVWFGGTASAIVDNIPFTATMVEIVAKIVEENPSEQTSPLWWALVMGADFGGNATMVGASANVLVVSMARARGYPISFIGFMKYRIPISVVSMLISTGYIWIRYY